MNAHFTDWTLDGAQPAPVRPSLWQRLRAAIAAYNEHVYAMAVMRAEWETVMVARQQHDRDRDRPLL